MVDVETALERARRRQEARVGVDRPARVEEVERRPAPRQLDVGLVERLDGADVGPVAAEDVGVDDVGRNRLRDDLLAEVDARGLEHLEQHFAVEDVDAHRGDERLLDRGPAGDRSLRDAAADLRQTLGRRLLFEADDLAQVVELQDPHLRRVVGRHRLGGDGDVGVALDVRLDELVEVHAVEVIARQDQEVLGVEALEVARGLAHRVGGALEPVRAVGRLLGGQHFDEAVREHVQPVGLRDVAVERGGVELRQHEDALEAGVQAVADRDVNQAVLAARAEPRASSACGSAGRGAFRARRRESGSTRHSCRQYLILRAPEGASRLHRVIRLRLKLGGPP